MLKAIFKILFFFLLGIGGGIFGSQILWPLLVEKPLFLKYKLDSNPIYVTEKKEVYIQENIALQTAIEKVEKTVVFIRTKTKTGKFLEGCGLILTSDGLIITLAELFPTNSSPILFIENEITPFQILKKDQNENLILLKVEKKNLKTTGFAVLEKLKLGERIFLVGKVSNNKAIITTVNEGIIKNFDGEKIETNIKEEQNLIGSPLFNIEGNLIGLAIIDKEGRVFSIPVKKIKNFANL